MPIDTSPSQVATSALQSLPFGNIIGGPLKACIEAQAMAAKTSWNFIQEVGLNTDPKTGEKKTVNVSFQFIKDGRVAQLNVPLLTIVPIPYIAIQTIDINFKANINASASNSKVENESTSIDAGMAGSASLNLGIFKVNADFHANYSSKKDSTATQDSKYSVEYTMDVAVKAGQDSMPAGLPLCLWRCRLWTEGHQCHRVGAFLSGELHRRWTGCTDRISERLHLLRRRRNGLILSE